MKEGFTILPYIQADPVLAKRLEEVGAATVMPLGAPIGSNRGVETRAMIEIIIEQACVPVIVDAGLGAPSHAAEALEMGADAVLVNTAIAVAEDPAEMAQAFRLGVEAGRRGFKAGLGTRSQTASATSPLTGFLGRMSGTPGDPLEGLPFARSRAVESFEEWMFGSIRLEELAERAREETRKNFGKTMRLFAPLYLSNECCEQLQVLWIF